MINPQGRFGALGKHLKFVREQSKQSLAEVSGAVEIDETLLARIEAGEERPAEDVLLLLISHFGVQEHEAVQLWHSAQYESEIPDSIKGDHDIPSLSGKPVVMLLAADMRTLYSDGLDIVASATGLTFNFTQTNGPSQIAPVARVGMSIEQAERVLKTLQQVLLQTKYSQGPKLLPPPRTDQNRHL